MGMMILRRLMSTVPTILGVATLIFLLVRVIPGDPAAMMLGDYATPELHEQLRHQLGLDKPLYVQYFNFLAQLLRGDLGNSIRSNQPVWDRIIQAMPYTLQLATGALLVSVVLGVSAGMLAAVKRNTWIDTSAMVVAMTGYSMPAFWLGMLLLLVFAVRLGWFPVLGASQQASQQEGVLMQLKYLVLPVLAVGLRQAGLIGRMTRSRLVEILTEDYIRTAWAKGLGDRGVLVGHALKNAAIPVVTVIGLTAGQLLGGTLATEIVFTRPGMGRLLVDAVFARDYPMLQSLVIVWALGLVLINLIVDLSYLYLDPRIRHT
jgi:ABC-type dipeptide/oligopeptide/nickel transport system permease component